MVRLRRPQIAVIALLLTFTGLGGVVVAAERAFETTLKVLLPSAPAPLLDPIAESGRTGWTCAPEIAAGASQARKAALPEPDR